MTIIRQEFGSSIAIGLTGDRQEIEAQFMSYFNRDGVTGELNWMTDTFAWFWARPKKFRQCLINIELAKIVNYLDAKLNRMKDKKKQITEEAPYEKLAELRAEDTFKKIEKVRFMTSPIKGEVVDNVFYSKHQVDKDEELT